MVTCARPAADVRRGRQRSNMDCDPELIRRAAGGDLDAYRECIDRLSPRVHAIAYQMCGDSDEARDIAQDVFIRLYHTLEMYKPSARFSTWVYRMTVNLAIDHRRRSARHRHTSLEAMPEPEAIPDARPLPDSRAAASEFRGTIRKLVRRLSGKRRSVFVLRDMQGIPTAEVATILNCRQSTVRVHLARARETIGKALREEFPELSGGIM